MATPAPCPCGSKLDSKACCLPLIQGARKAATAEELLRSRYTAFTRADVDYILASHHSKTRAEVKREEIEDWAKNSEWLGLEIVQSEAGKATDDKGTLVFCARYREKTSVKSAAGATTEAPKDQEHWEQAFFEKEAGEWRFIDARGIRTGPYVREAPKTGRNDPCTCGSGKKFKKCCGL